jgi:hypothetical protein
MRVLAALLLSLLCSSAYAGDFTTPGSRAKNAFPTSISIEHMDIVLGDWSSYMELDDGGETLDIGGPENSQTGEDNGTIKMRTGWLRVLGNTITVEGDWAADPDDASYFSARINGCAGDPVCVGMPSGTVLGGFDFQATDVAGSGNPIDYVKLDAIATSANSTGELNVKLSTAGVNAYEYIFGGTSFRPYTNDGVALGDADQMWSDLFLADGAVTNYNNGDVTITKGTDALAISGDDRTNIVLNHTAPLATFNGGTPVFQALGTSAGHSNIAGARFTNDAFGPANSQGKSRGASVGTYTAVQSGDVLAQYIGYGADGDELFESAQISFEAEGTVANDQVPGVIIVATASSAGTMTDRWSWNSSGHYIPAADATYDVGTTALGINDLHLGLDGVINFDGGDVTITHSANDLAFTGVTGDYSFDDTVGVTGSVTASVNVTATAGDVTSGDDVIPGDDILMGTGGGIDWGGGILNLTYQGTDLVSFQGGSFGVHQANDTIATGAVGFSRQYLVIDTEAAAATDDLDTMTAPPSNFGGVPRWVQAANDARTVVIKGDSTGNIVGPGGADCILDDAEDAATMIFNSTSLEWVITSCSQVNREHIAVAASDETTPITAATGKVKFRMPYAFNVDSVRCSLSTAQNTTGAGTIFTVDINEGDADLDGGNPISILSTKVTIDDDETTSMTATTAPVLSDVALAADAEMTIDVDAIGASADAAGLKCSLIGHQ